MYLTGYRLSSREAKAGTKTRIEAKILEECCLLACPFLFCFVLLNTA